MNRFLINLKLPLLAILLFFLFQVVASFSVVLIQAVVNGRSLLDSFVANVLDVSTMGIVSVLANVLIAVSCLFLFRRNRYTEKISLPPPAPLPQSLLAFVACIAATIALDLLSELNAEGTTIVMVTHSQKDAAVAQRVINLFDGQIVGDVKNEL